MTPSLFFNCFESLTLILLKNRKKNPAWIFQCIYSRELNCSETKHCFHLKEGELAWQNWQWLVQESQICTSVILDIFTFFLNPSLCLLGLWWMKSVVLLLEVLLRKLVAWKQLKYWLQPFDSAIPAVRVGAMKHFLWHLFSHCIIIHGTCSARQESQIYDMYPQSLSKMIYLHLHINSNKPIIPTSKEIRFSLIFIICMMWKSLVSIPGFEFSHCLSLFSISISPASLQAGPTQAEDQRN